MNMDPIANLKNKRLNIGMITEVHHSGNDPLGQNDGFTRCVPHRLLSAKAVKLPSVNLIIRVFVVGGSILGYRVTSKFNSTC